MSTDTTQTLQVGFPVGRSRLEAMPDELLLVVLNDLGGDLEYLDTIDRAPFNKGISELLSLCLVSKRLEAVVRSVIFGKVLICQSTQLVRLLRTLIENPGLGERIRTLEFATQFSRVEPDHEVLDLEVLRGLDSDLDAMLPQTSSSMNSRQENDIRSNLYVKVLEKAPNVKKVSINYPTLPVRGLDGGDLAASAVADAVAHKQAAMPQASLRRLPESLKSLSVEGETLGIEEGLPKQISGMWSQDLADGSKLYKMAWFCDHTPWFDALPGQEWTSAGTSKTAMISGTRDNVPVLMNN